MFHSTLSAGLGTETELRLNSVPVPRFQLPVPLGPQSQGDQSAPSETGYSVFRGETLNLLLTGEKRETALTTAV